MSEVPSGKPVSPHSRTIISKCLIRGEKKRKLNCVHTRSHQKWTGTRVPPPLRVLKLTRKEVRETSRPSAHQPAPRGRGSSRHAQTAWPAHTAHTAFSQTTFLPVGLGASSSGWRSRSGPGRGVGQGKATTCESHDIPSRGPGRTRRGANAVRQVSLPGVPPAGRFSPTDRPTDRPLRIRLTWVHT